MRILVTGGTGFVGGHTVKELVSAGHEVKLLVRDTARVAATLDPLGVQALEVEVGDVTDAAAVRSALAGCEAVLHGASVYSNDTRRAQEVKGTNVLGAQTVLGQAVELGLDPVVHVSSIVALMPAPRPERVVREDGPVGESGPPYPASKQAQERYARSLQETGAPVVITYPGSVWGPDDPYDGESTRVARDFARGMVPFLPGGGLPIVDVRDLAAAQARVFEPGKGPRRFVLGGEAIPIRRLARLVQAEAGGWRPRIPIPALAAYGAGVAAGGLQRMLPFRLPIDPTGPWTSFCNVTADNSRAVEELGATFRPFTETLHDQVAWQRAAGKL